jgi:hypothetical protein
VIFVPNESECAPTVPLGEAGNFEVVPEEELTGDAELRKHFSEHALRTANACGLAPLLRRYWQPPQDTLQRLKLRQNVMERLAIISLEITGVSAELDCEEERADQVADYLLDLANTRITKLTLISILLGAIGAVITGVLALCKVDERISTSSGILFGLAVTTVGLITLTADQAVVPFTHERNLLAELAHQPARPKLFPVAVWTYLNRSNNQQSKPESLRDRLLKRWQESGELGAKSEVERQRLMNLLFGSGGPYQASELHIRANMFDQLESYVDLMNLDVQRLAREFADSEVEVK